VLFTAAARRASLLIADSKQAPRTIAASRLPLHPATVTHCRANNHYSSFLLSPFC